ncbi:hypothetical protein YYC_03226 [Plasmodium yoelii 17X]|uniref:Uncharacterized protein n=4 Tax=Plasmodium yoelii TaxID=5861 RepID=Q7RSA9_PLAYO|nr:conserved Plasmodium protein, unknown function [Plasmodium yoelii]EAA16047.1 hypothetical protein [Plasmodium yoelii yoelii]ETB59849.1 hypothetical protein YYC_03226 [Plasmodium yoelii 17X]WBY57817.1 hypothetical protein Py17XNL_001002135 [Plasmodium yoelii yoelii]CDU84918.1 conserved Plasmodium protein, unknown function [Plasmodium yoelii]VTZ78814.1 conserved Plasmodium protein, unknown function [Plasmodium yoelii]|eukprot:XP_724482.1 conserved Plasmodium protein, unknown function [Plasmodium yoelii]
MSIINYIYFLSILFLQITSTYGISTNEVLRDKKLEFIDYAKFIIDESNLVDKNEKLLGSSLRTYKYYLVKSATEIRAIFIYDDFNVEKADMLDMNIENHKLDIINLENIMNFLYPLDETSIFSEDLYKERKMYSLETDYSATTYVLIKFVFNVNIEKEDDEYVLSLLIGNELNMKNKNLEIVKNDNDKLPQLKDQRKDLQNNDTNFNILNRNKLHPQVFTQFIGAIIGIVSMITSISGAISAVSPMFSGSDTPSPPTFLGDENSSLPTYSERIHNSTPSKNTYNNTRDEFYDEYEDEYDDDYYNDYDNGYDGEDDYYYYDE